MYMNNNTKKITTMAMLAAIAYVVVVVGRIPVVLFLKYDPKDIIITCILLILSLNGII